MTTYNIALLAGDGTGKEVTDEAVSPTCTSTGLTEGKHCSVCNKVLVAQEEVAKTQHNYGTTYKSDETEHWHECECGDKTDKEAHSGGTATGIQKAECDVCGQAYGELVPASTGCKGSVLTSMIGLVVLAGATIVLRKRREE